MLEPLLIKLQVPCLQLYEIRYPGIGVFVQIVQNFQQHLFYRTLPSDCF